MSDEEAERDRRSRYAALQEEKARLRATTPAVPRAETYKNAHRCNDRWEDVLRSVTSFSLGQTPQMVSLFAQCFKSEEG